MEYQTLFIALKFLFFLLSSKSFISSLECVKRSNPEKLSDCSNLETSKGKECCYLRFQYRGNDIDQTECTEIDKSKVTSNSSFLTEIGEITKRHIRDDSPYIDVRELNCQSNNYKQSDCGTVISVSSFNSCYNKTTLYNKEGKCCYLNGKSDKDQTYYEQCVDIKKDDVDNLDKVKKEIVEGKYWKTFPIPIKDIASFRCEEKNPCEETMKPKEFKDCYGKEVSDDENECCYFYAEKNTGKGNAQRCVSIKKEDCGGYEALKSIVDEIAEGDYWDDFPMEYSEVKELTCEKGQFLQSDCEKTHMPSPESCKGKSVSITREKCCYLKGRVEGDELAPECVDILKEDTNDLEIVKERIKNGTYWSDYTKRYDYITDLICYDKVNYISVNILKLLSFVLLSLF